MDKATIRKILKNNKGSVILGLLLVGLAFSLSIGTIKYITPTTEKISYYYDCDVKTNNDSSVGTFKCDRKKIVNKENILINVLKKYEERYDRLGSFNKPIPNIFRFNFD